MPIIMTSTIAVPVPSDPYPLTTVNLNQSNTVFLDTSASEQVTSNGQDVGLILNLLGTNIYNGE